MNTDHWKSLIWNCRIHGRSQSWHSSSLSFEMSHWNYSYCCSCTTHPSMTCSCCPGCWFHNWRRCEAWLDQDVRKMCALGQGRSDKLEPIAAISEAWWEWNIDANESNESLCLVYATSKFLKVFLCCQNLCSQRNQIQKCHETQHNPGDTNPSLRGLLLSQFFVQIPDRPEQSHLDQSSMVIPLDPIDPYWTFESPASPTSPMGFQEKTTPRPCSNLSAFWIELAGKRQTSSQHIVSKHSEKMKKRIWRDTASAGNCDGIWLHFKSFTDVSCFCSSTSISILCLIKPSQGPHHGYSTSGTVASVPTRLTICRKALFHILA